MSIYTLLRDFVIRPGLRAAFRITVVGLENVPKDGPLICASNHEAVVDSFLIPALIKRRFTFMAKEEYFTATGPVGWVKKKFFGIAAVPVKRGDRDDGKRALDTLSRALKGGGAVGLHPEGTRTPGDKVYKGKGGVIDLAWETGAKVLPVALSGTSTANPPGKRIPRFRTKITVTIGEPMTFTKPPLTPGFARLPFRSKQTEQLMREIARLAGVPYTPIDAAKSKSKPLSTVNDE